MAASVAFEEMTAEELFECDVHMASLCELLGSFGDEYLTEVKAFAMRDYIVQKQTQLHDEMQTVHCGNLDVFEYFFGQLEEKMTPIWPSYDADYILVAMKPGDVWIPKYFCGFPVDIALCGLKFRKISVFAVAAVLKIHPLDLMMQLALRWKPVKEIDSGLVDLLEKFKKILAAQLWNTDFALELIDEVPMGELLHFWEFIEKSTMETLKVMSETERKYGRPQIVDAEEVKVPLTRKLKDLFNEFWTLTNKREFISEALTHEGNTIRPADRSSLVDLGDGVLIVRVNGEQSVAVDEAAAAAAAAEAAEAAEAAAVVEIPVKAKGMGPSDWEEREDARMALESQSNVETRPEVSSSGEDSEAMRQLTAQVQILHELGLKRCALENILKEIGAVAVVDNKAQCEILDSKEDDGQLLLEAVGIVRMIHAQFSGVDELVCCVDGFGGDVDAERVLHGVVAGVQTLKEQIEALEDGLRGLGVLEGSEHEMKAVRFSSWVILPLNEQELEIVEDSMPEEPVPEAQSSEGFEIAREMAEDLAVKLDTLEEVLQSIGAADVVDENVFYDYEDSKYEEVKILLDAVEDVRTLQEQMRGVEELLLSVDSYGGDEVLAEVQASLMDLKDQIEVVDCALRGLGVLKGSGNDIQFEEYAHWNLREMPPDVDRPEFFDKAWHVLNLKKALCFFEHVLEEVGAVAVAEGRVNHEVLDGKFDESRMLTESVTVVREISEFILVCEERVKSSHVFGGELQCCEVIAKLQPGVEYIQRLVDSVEKDLRRLGVLSGFDEHMHAVPFPYWVISPEISTKDSPVVEDCSAIVVHYSGPVDEDIAVDTNVELVEVSESTMLHAQVAVSEQQTVAAPVVLEESGRSINDAATLLLMFNDSPATILSTEASEGPMADYEATSFLADSDDDCLSAATPSSGGELNKAFVEEDSEEDSVEVGANFLPVEIDDFVASPLPSLPSRRSSDVRSLPDSISEVDDEVFVELEDPPVIYYPFAICDKESDSQSIEAVSETEEDFNRERRQVQPLLLRLNPVAYLASLGRPIVADNIPADKEVEEPTGLLAGSPELEVGAEENLATLVSNPAEVALKILLCDSISGKVEPKAGLSRVLKFETTRLATELTGVPQLAPSSLAPELPKPIQVRPGLPTKPTLSTKSSSLRNTPFLSRPIVSAKPSPLTKAPSPKAVAVSKPVLSTKPSLTKKVAALPNSAAVPKPSLQAKPSLPTKAVSLPKATTVSKPSLPVKPSLPTKAASLPKADNVSKASFSQKPPLSKPVMSQVSTPFPSNKIKASPLRPITTVSKPSTGRRVVSTAKTLLASHSSAARSAGQSVTRKT